MQKNCNLITVVESDSHETGELDNSSSDAGDVDKRRELLIRASVLEGVLKTLSITASDLAAETGISAGFLSRVLNLKFSDINRCEHYIVKLEDIVKEIGVTIFRSPDQVGFFVPIATLGEYKNKTQLSDFKNKAFLNFKD